ncbi:MULTISPECIES: nucleoside hydrolase [Microbacterium]|uniref:nucleoside hydrolase n=1 Tax=Microbacterium TaxID=33882 RepID=UPI00146E9C32|nr:MULTISPECIES: nucleoside hydrolase [Microbacterium]
MRVVVDCDPGNGQIAADVDDGIALGLLWASADVHVEAVTVVDGNVAHDIGARVAASLAALSGTETPVYDSALTAAGEPAGYWRAQMDARSSTDDVDLYWTTPTVPLPGDPDPTQAVDALTELLHLHPADSLSLLAIGPLTNLAGLERRHPGTLARAHQLVVLGGAFTGPTGLRELNFAVDPEAADLVLSTDAPITLLPLDVSRQSWLTLQDVAVLSAAPHPLVRHLAATAVPWVRWISHSRDWPGANFHDVLAAAILIDPTLATYRDGRVRVDISDGPSRSRPYLAGQDGPHRIVASFDHDRFMRLVLDTLGAWQPERTP